MLWSTIVPSVVLLSYNVGLIFQKLKIKWYIATYKVIIIDSRIHVQLQLINGLFIFASPI